MSHLSMRSGTLGITRQDCADRPNGGAPHAHNPQHHLVPFRRHLALPGLCPPRTHFLPFHHHNPRRRRMLPHRLLRPMALRKTCH